MIATRAPRRARIEDRWPRTALVWAALPLVLQGCARPGAPRGGPEDDIPPLVVETFPEANATVEPPQGPVIVRFSERISERAASGPLDQAVLVSPESGPVRVRVRGDRLEILPEEGFRSGLVYRVRIAPVIRDRFQNVMPEPFELVFSTGAPVLPNAIAGLAWDRITGEPVRDLRVEAATPSDETLHLARTDTAGIFDLRHLPEGPITLTAYQDRNRNRTFDLNEPAGQSALLLGAADTLLVLLPILTPDTSAARLLRAELDDSVTVRLEFDDPLDPDAATLTMVSLAADSVPVSGIVGVFAKARLDELRALEAERALEGEGGPPGVAGGGPPAPAPPGGAVSAGSPASPRTGPDGTPLPERELYLRLSEPAPVDVEVTVQVSGVRNLMRVAGGGGTARFTRSAPPPAPAPPTDPAAGPGNVPPDSAAVPRSDSLAVEIPPDAFAAADLPPGPSSRGPSPGAPRRHLPESLQEPWTRAEASRRSGG